MASDMNQLEHSDGFRVIKNERCPDCLTTDDLLGDRLNDNRNSAVVFPYMTLQHRDYRLCQWLL